MEEKEKFSARTLKLELEGFEGCELFSSSIHIDYKYWSYELGLGWSQAEGRIGRGKTRLVQPSWTGLTN